MKQQGRNEIDLILCITYSRSHDAITRGFIVVFYMHIKITSNKADTKILTDESKQGKKSWHQMSGVLCETL